MNPFAWRQEHQVAILLGAILGAVILEVIGFMYRGLNYGTIGPGLWSASTARWDDPRGLHRLRATLLQM